jgi:XTP/dITP diphosphohydrolase
MNTPGALPQVISASANPDKVAEIRAILAGLLHVEPRPGDVADVVEDAGTLEGNARLKAAAICAATGEASMADDTGLFVDALDGEPGVDTAYYAGPHATYAENRAKLLAALDGAQTRRAVFRTVAMIVWPDGRELSATGECAGTIALAESGGRGWGFDPLFIPDDGDGRTFAEMSDADKHAVSHRGRAFANLVAALRATAH